MRAPVLRNLLTFTFWLAVVLAALGNFIIDFAGARCGWFLLVAVLSLAGLFIPKRTYRIAGSVLLVLALAWAYHEYRRGVRYWAARTIRAVASEDFASSPMQDVPVRVVDSVTGEPVVGAAVHPICMGLTPYGTNVYHTDQHGVASVKYYQSWPGVALRIESKGYQTNFSGALKSNPIVRLNRTL